MDEYRDRHTPGTLPGNTPVRAFRDHAPDTLFPPGGRELYLVDLTQCVFPQSHGIHAEKPLWGGPENDRRLVAPAMGITMLQFVHVH